MGKPTTFTVKHYDKTITIEIDHSDVGFNEVMEVFESLTIAMGFSKDSFRDWVKESGEEFTREDEEELREAAERYNANLIEENSFLNLRHSGDNFEDYQNQND